MHSLKKAVLYGFLIWSLALAVSMALYPIKKSRPELFDSIMPVILVVLCLAGVTIYFRNCATRPVREAALLGLIWLGINIAMDLPLFSFGPMKMPLIDYFADIGLTYLILPAITVGAGLQAAVWRKPRCEA